MMQRDAGFAQARGIALMLLSCIFLTLGDATSKLLTTSYPVGEIIFARSIVILVISFSYCAWAGSIAPIMPYSLSNQIRRSFSFIVSTFLVNWSFQLLPLPVAHSILFCSPIVMTALAPLLLGETVGISRWIAVVIGFVGVLVVIDPMGANWQWAAIVPLAAAVAAALRDLATRAMANVETAISLLFFMGATTAVVSLATAPFGWTLPTWPDGLLMVGFGSLTTLAMFIQVLAFRNAEAGLLAPFKYSSLLWSLLLGVLLWSYIPSIQTLCGAAIVIGSGLFILQREIALRRRRPVVKVDA